MAVIRISSYGDHFTPEKLKEWPDPEAVSLMEVLAREDIDKAVHAILLRENYVVKKLDTYFQHLDISKERRKEVLHKKWVTNVAEPLQERIMDKVMSYGRIKKRKQRNFDYLQHTNKTVFVPPLCDPLFQRQREVAEESRDILQCETGAKYSMKEFLDIEKARLHSSLPPFTFTLHTVVPKETWKPPARDQRSKIPNPCSGIIEPSLCQLAQKNKCDKMIYHKCYARLQPSAFNAIRSVSTPTTRVPRRRPEKLTCVENEHLCNKERKATDLSQIAFKRQFHFSKLKQENKNDKKGHQMVLEARKHRPKSWTAGESLHQEGLQTLERKVMTAEVLANHLASMRVGDRQGSYKLYHL